MSVDLLAETRRRTARIRQTPTRIPEYTIGAASLRNPALAANPQVGGFSRSSASSRRQPPWLHPPGPRTCLVFVLGVVLEVAERLGSAHASEVPDRLAAAGDHRQDGPDAGHDADEHQQRVRSLSPMTASPRSSRMYPGPGSPFSLPPWPRFLRVTNDIAGISVTFAIFRSLPACRLAAVITPGLQSLVPPESILMTLMFTIFDHDAPTSCMWATSSS